MNAKIPNYFTNNLSPLTLYLKTIIMKENLILGLTVFVAVTAAIVAANKVNAMIG